MELNAEAWPLALADLRTFVPATRRDRGGDGPHRALRIARRLARRQHHGEPRRGARRRLATSAPRASSPGSTAAARTSRSSPRTRMQTWPSPAGCARSTRSRRTTWASPPITCRAASRACPRGRPSCAARTSRPRRGCGARDSRRHGSTSTQPCAARPAARASPATSTRATACAGRCGGSRSTTSTWRASPDSPGPARSAAPRPRAATAPPAPPSSRCATRSTATGSWPRRRRG